MGGTTIRTVKVPDKKSYDPCVWRLFGLLQHRGISISQLAEKSGVAKKTLFSWLYKQRSPQLINFRAAANALGYELVLVPIDTVDRYYGPPGIEIGPKDS